MDVAAAAAWARAAQHANTLRFVTWEKLYNKGLVGKLQGRVRIGRNQVVVFAMAEDFQGRNPADVPPVLIVAELLLDRLNPHTAVDKKVTRGLG